MKITDRQIKALANEIKRKVNEKRKEIVISPILTKQIDDFIKQKEKLYKQQQEILDKIRLTTKNLQDKLPGNLYLNQNDSKEYILEKVRTFSTSYIDITIIENDIILKALFADEKDMKGFMEELIEKYSPKTEKK